MKPSVFNKVIVFILFFILLSSQAIAKGFKTYTVVDGLLDSAVNCIYQDKKGVLWFGSRKGITRFDGVNFKSFKTSNVDERVEVLAIFQDKSDIMWVITEIGVLLWTGNEFQEAYKHHGITSFCLDAEHNRWLGSKNGITIFGEGLDEQSNSDLKDVKGVTALFMDRESNIWIGTDNGAYFYNGRDLKHYTTEDGLAGNIINAIYEDGDNIFFATNGGVTYYNGMLWGSYTTEEGLADNYTTSIFKDFRGKFWFGTRNGISIFDESAANYFDAWQKMTTEEGLADNYITCLYLDKSSNLWIGTKNGATKHNISFDYLIKVQGIKEQLSSPVFYDMNNTLWFSTEDGVTSFLKNSYERLKEDDGISGKVLSIFEDTEEEKIYFGTEYGINEYEAGSITVTHKPMPKKKEGRYTEGGAFVYYEVLPDKDIDLVGKKVHAIAKDAAGDMWFATEMALNRLIDSQWTTFTTEEGLLSNNVNALLLGNDGILYIGTKYGINTYSDEEITETTITNSDGLPTSEVLSLFQDSKGNLWIGTKLGVSKYDGNNFENFSLDDGLMGDQVFTIFEDSRGFMWFATEGGLSKYDGENFSTYTTVDGLLSNEVHSIAEDKNGIIWFGTEFGIIRYQPDNAPPTSFVMNLPEEPIVLPKYTFNVAGADLNSIQSELLFSYKLDNSKWTKFTPKTVIDVQKLKNGTHYLYVRAKDKGLNIQDPPLKAAFEVNTAKFDLEIVDIKFEDIFSVLYQYYNSMRDIKKDPLGTITIKNKFDKDIKVKVTSFVKDCMDFPADTRGTVKAKGTMTIPLRLEFNENILTMPSGHKKINISLQYYLHGENKENNINSSIMIYDKNSVTWDNPNKIGAFVTVTEKIVNDFARKIVQRYKDESKESIIYDNLIRAMQIFDALGAYGIRYIADPTTPYSGLKKQVGTLDTLRFPKQTIELRSGDCDDCVVLYCSMLENIGINTAVIDTYDHLLMMFDVGLKKKDLRQITEDESQVHIDFTDQVWIPVESTMFGKTFSEAWEAGAIKLNRPTDRKFYFLEEAWKVYQPAEISTTDEEVDKIYIPDKAMVNKIYKKDVAIQEGKLLYNIVAKYEKMIEEDPNNAQAYNSLGIAYAKSGYFEKAEKLFNKVIELRPEFHGGHLNLGNIFFEYGYYDKAVQEYKKSLTLDPENAYVFLEMAITYSLMDDFENAKKAYLNAIKISPDIEKER